MSRLRLFLVCVGVAGCGKTMPTSALAACPAIPKNYQRTDTMFVGLTKVPAFILSTYACDGAIVTTVTTP